MSQPIPKRLLIHNITVKHAAAVDDWGNVTEWTILAQPKVRVDLSLSMQQIRNQGNQNDRQQDKGTIYHDAVNSGSAAYAVDDYVDFDGNTCKITRVESLYDGQKLHHYEVGIV